MPHIIWTDNLNTGIDVIDSQHRQLIDYINQLHDIRLSHDKKVVATVIEAMVDYTISHFGFEEALMEDAGYEFFRPHKRVHELFIKRIEALQRRFNNGEDILEELHSLLTRWLFNHIKNDDASYISSVKPKVQLHIQEEVRTGWLTRSLRRFFVSP
ncbi:MAG TPA: bacteriohemerythrin [Gammaproteobacteria bacterium]